jgi:hypothetical protein
MKHGKEFGMVDNSDTLIEQTYQGEQDYIEVF